MGSPAFLTACLALCLLAGCTGTEQPEIPRGYYARLELVADGKQLSFGPFVGYYFKPVTGDRLDRLEFVCYNERGFYTDEAARNALLFRGEARLTTLPEEIPLPEAADRIEPLFFAEAPAEWLATRPEPATEYVHFHSAYSPRAASHTGYWLRHEPVIAFTYNMGGRLDATSPLYHHAEPGSPERFPQIIEFDHGPGWTR